MASVLYASTAGEDSCVYAGPCKVEEIIITNTDSAAVYALIFDLAALPADTTDADVAVIRVDATSTVSWDPKETSFENGVVVSFSSTAPEKTITAATAGVFQIHGRV